MGDTFTTREARLQDAKNRQNSIELDDESDLHYAWREKQREVIDKARSVYEWAIQNGIFKEQAPQFIEGNTRKHDFLYEWNPKKLDPITLNYAEQTEHKRNTCK